MLSMQVMKLPGLFEESISSRAQLYISAVILSGWILFLYCVYSALLLPDLRWLFLLGLTFVASSFAVKIPLIKGGEKSAFSMGEVFVFTAILLFGPEVAVIVAVVEGCGANSRGRVQRRYRQFFNLSQLGIASFLVGQLFYHLQGKAAPLDPSQVQDPARLLVEVGICTLVYFVLNSGIVALAVALATNQSCLEVWKENFLWAWIPCFAGGSLGAVVFLCFREVHFYFIAIAVPTALLIHYAYKIHLQHIQLLSEINDRKAAEKALATEKERLAVTLQSIGDGVITIDKQRQIFLINRVAERFTGWTQEEAVGHSLREVFHAIHKKTDQKYRDIGEEVLKKGKTLLNSGRDIALVARDGTKR